MPSCAPPASVRPSPPPAARAAALAVGLLTVGPLAAACRDATPAERAPAVRLAPATTTLVVGQRTRLVVTDGGGRSTDAVRWRATPSGIVEIDAAGVILARSPGVATVEAVPAADGGAPARATVEVQPTAACLLAVAITPQLPGIVIGVGATRGVGAVVASCDPAVRVDSTVELAVVDPEVAALEGGRVVGRRPGITALVARARANPQAAATLQVAVVCQAPLLATLVLGPPHAVVTVGDTVRLRPSLRIDTPTCLPDAVAGALRWETADSLVVRLRGDGVVLGRRAGEARVTARSVLLPGLAATVHVSVREP